MNKNVIISVKGCQKYGNDEDCIELITQGKYYKKGVNYFVTYKETEITGMDGTTTTLKIENDKVTLMRFGQNNSQLIFEKGQKHICYYETPYGAFTVGVLSNKLDINIDDCGGDLFVGYELEIDNAAAGENNFYLKIREAGTNDKLDRKGEDADYKSH